MSVHKKTDRFINDPYDCNANLGLMLPPIFSFFFTCDLFMYNVLIVRRMADLKISSCLSCLVYKNGKPVHG